MPSKKNHQHAGNGGASKAAPKTPRGGHAHAQATHKTHKPDSTAPQPHTKHSPEAHAHSTHHTTNGTVATSLHGAHKAPQASSAVHTPDPWARETDFTDAAYTPHTLTVLVGIVMAILFALRYCTYPSMSGESNVKLGLVASALLFVAFGAVHLPDAYMVRPHPALWRAVLACGILYTMFLAFCLFQDYDTVKQIFVYYDPSLAIPPVEREYATDCRLSTPEKPYLFFETAFDVFVIAHSLGYIVKAFILRDWRMVTCVSLGFEVLEVSFQHVLPNFRECWWDHIILDVILCNAGGTIVGMWLLQKLKAKRYSWIALREIPSVGGKAKRLLGQLGPRSFESYEWNVFQSPKRLFQVMGILALMFIQEMNCFTLKAMLNQSPTHPLVLARLLLWGLLAMPGIREYYEYMNNPTVKRIGTTAWITTLGLTVELILSFKLMYEGNFFRHPLMPDYVAVPWLVALVCFGVWMCLYFGVLSPRSRAHRFALPTLLVNAFYYAAVLSILALFLMGLPDLQIGRQQFETYVGPYADTILFWRR